MNILVSKLIVYFLSFAFVVIVIAYKILWEFSLCLYPTQVSVRSFFCIVSVQSNRADGMTDSRRCFIRQYVRKYNRS